MPMSDLSRRDFVSASVLAAGAAISAATFPRSAHARPAPRPLTDEQAPAKAAKPLNILILGGTAFTGPHVVRHALARGHRVTVFNRGRTEQRIGPLPGEVTRLVGDRDPDKGEGLTALKSDQTWDAVLDTSGQFPRHVRASGELLAPRIQRYIFISSISAIADPMPPSADESAPTATLRDPDVEDFGANFENYAGLKAACEAAAEKALPGRACSIRPGLIVGPGDPTDRFTYWPVRVSRWGNSAREVLCPGHPSDQVQFIDVRDLAEFLVLAIEQSLTGIYHAIGPSPTTSIGDLVETCKRISKSDAALTFVPADFLASHRVTPWGDMPVWIPPDVPASAEGLAADTRPRVSFAKARRAGLRSRSIDDTVAATLAWWPTEVARRVRVTAEMMEQARKDGAPAPRMADPPNPEKLRAGISPEREAAVLKAWHAR